MALDAAAVEGADLEYLIDKGSKDLHPAMVKLQVLLDRAGASPGVIDGVAGHSVDKALVANEKMNGLTEDGVIDSDLIAALEDTEAVLQTYEIGDEEVSDLVDAIPEDYAENAKLQYLGLTSGAEALAERFHMDVVLLVALNPGASFVAGEKVLVPKSERTSRKEWFASRLTRNCDRFAPTMPGESSWWLIRPRSAVKTIQGVHKVNGVARMPGYTYNPELNFQQGQRQGIGDSSRAE